MRKILSLFIVISFSFLCSCQSDGLSRSYVISEKVDKFDQKYLSDEMIETSPSREF